jgi:hypothetical protein
LLPFLYWGLENILGGIANVQGQSIIAQTIPGGIYLLIA